MSAGPGFPWATLTVNVLGSLAIGLAAGLFAARLDGSMRLGVVVGFLGGFTTFSAFSSETVELVRNGSPELGLLNMAVTMMLGIAAVVIGVLIGESIAR